MKAAIIGAGEMGRWFAKFLKGKGWDIKITDKDRETAERVSTELDIGLATNNRDAVKGADVALISVPIKETPGVIEDVSNVLEEDALLMDIASVKEKPVDKMKSLETKAELASMHPLFGPGAESLENKNIIAVPVKPGDKYEKLRGLLREEGAKLEEMEAEEHDKIMAVIQGLTHFTLLAYTSALDSMKDSEKALKFLTPMSNKLLELTKAFLRENPEICGDIQTENKYSSMARSSLLEACRKLNMALKARNTRFLAELFEKTQERLGMDEIEAAYEDLYKQMEDEE